MFDKHLSLVHMCPVNGTAQLHVRSPLVSLPPTVCKCDTKDETSWSFSKTSQVYKWLVSDNQYHSVRTVAKYMNWGHAIARTRQNFFTISTNKRTQLSLNSQQYYTTHYWGLNNNFFICWLKLWKLNYNARNGQYKNTRQMFRKCTVV